jgi:hypothetical protein
MPLALALLRATPGIDPKRIFVLGHPKARWSRRIAAADEAAGAIDGAPPLVVLIDQLNFGRS